MGLIGMGKLIIVKMFVEEGIFVYDVDWEVYFIYEKGGVVVLIVVEFFLDVVVDGKVDCVWLFKLVFGDKEVLKKLEVVVYFFVGKS